jgi:ribulose-5-phosphate 4-epimerase/fuculose-1-phosphate aldolase
MTPEQLEAARELCDVALSLYQRGYTFGTAGNMSVRCGDVVLITPTNSSFGRLTPGMIARVDLAGASLGGAKPSKELPFHLAAYEADSSAGAVVHLHSTHAVAVSCLRGVNCEDALPVLTPYYAMRLPRLPVVAYCPPGDPALGPAVREALRGTRACLLRNHGSIAVGATLLEAAALAEEIEEQARLALILAGRGRELTVDEIAELRRRFK